MSNKALNYPAGDLFRIPPEDVTIVGLDTDHKKGEHDLWDERIRLPVPESLILSIMVDGPHDPIHVCREGGKKDGLIVIVDGRQRVRATREANRRLESRGEPTWPMSAVYVRKDVTGLLGLMVSTNEHAQSDDLVTRAAKAARLREMGMSVAEIAIRFGVTDQTIRQWLKMHTLHPQLKEAIREGAVGMVEAISAHADATFDAQREAGIKYLDAAEGTAEKPQREKKPPRARRKARSEKVARRALVDAGPSRAAAINWSLDPAAPIDLLLEAPKGVSEADHLKDVVTALAWLRGAGET